MRFTAHQQSHTVTDVEVYDEASGTWKPIDPDRKYTIGLTDYYNGGGYFNTLKDCRQLELRPLIVRDAMTNYLVNTLGGNIPAAYAKSQGRITILDD